MYLRLEEFEDDETDDIFFIATDSEGDTELEDEDFSLDELQELDSEYSSDPALTKFPLGCNVWFNARTSRVSADTLKAKGASVVGVYMHFERLQKVYKLKSDTPSQCDTFLYEDRLVYGMNCPVTVTDPITSDLRDGVIVCPKPYQGTDGEQLVSYGVQTLQGSDITIDFGVAADRIKYRFEKPANDTATSKIIEVGESSAVKEVDAKAHKVEPKELPQCPPVCNDAESAPKPDTSAATSAETTSEEIPAVAAAGAATIDPDDYWSW